MPKPKLGTSSTPTTGMLKPKSGDTSTLADGMLAGTSAASDVSAGGGLPTDMILLVERITTAFTNSFNSCVERIIDAMDKKLSHRIESQDVEIFDLNKRIERLKKTSKDQEVENMSLK